MFSVHYSGRSEDKIIQKGTEDSVRFLAVSIWTYCTTMVFWPRPFPGENGVMVEATDQAHF